MKYVKCIKASKASTLEAQGRTYQIQPAEVGKVARVTDTRAQAMVNSGHWKFIDNREGRAARNV